MGVSQLVSDFFGRDVVLGDRALKAALADHGAAALQLLIPKTGGQGAGSFQVERRLAKLAHACASQSAVDHLVEVVRGGTWHDAQGATPAFAGLRRFAVQAEDGLVEILKGTDVNAQRLAVESLGFLGAGRQAYGIAEFACSGTWLQNTRSPSQYHLDKFYFYAVQALVRMTAHLNSVDDIDYCLTKLKDLLPICEEVLGANHVSDWDIRFVQHYFPPKAADPLIKSWIGNGSVFLQGRGLEALGQLRLNRTAAVLLDAMRNPHFGESASLQAGVSLSQFAHASAAALLAQQMESVSGSAGFEWAFASLYALDADWPECGELVDRILELDESSEIWNHMVYALACRGDARGQRCFTSLNSRHDYVRACSAIACARLDPRRAGEALQGRDEEAGGPMESACILAAQVHAGDAGKVDALHHVLTTFPQLIMLRPTWKREVLHAFFAAEGPESERGYLWCEAAAERPARVIAEVQALCTRVATAKPSPAPQSVPLPAGRAVERPKFDVFISHASEDKARIAQPLRDALVAAGVSVWFDKTELKLGDRLRHKIDDGLAHSRYGIVILSPSFLAKEWPLNELEGLMARETAAGGKAILPIWHDLGQQELVLAAPTLAGRLACRSSEGLSTIVAKILDVLND